jgi:hypothetical protein
MVFSSNPTVLTQYPRDQKCRPVTLLWSMICRWIRTALLPFKNLITNVTLYFGGTRRHMCTWSAIKCPSRSSTPRCLQRSRSISPIRRRAFPYRTLLRYFGTITTWYLQSHRTCVRLVQSCIGFSSCPTRGFPGGKTYFISPRIGRTSPGPPPEVEGLRKTNLGVFYCPGSHHDYPSCNTFW